MELNVQVEKSSSILLKLTVRVPAKEVALRYQKGLAEVQRTAKIRGFRPGHAPIGLIRQQFGDDVRHQLFNNLIDESYRMAVVQEKIKAVGNPKIETPDHQTGAGGQDHTLHEDKDLTFIATVEVLPEIEAKGYTGVSLTREKVEVTADDVQKVISGLMDQHAELVPTTAGTAAKKGDFVDMKFEGGIVTETGLDRREGMSGARMIEIGSGNLIPGFEENLIGLKAGDTKTFRVTFPADYFEKNYAAKEAEFTVNVNEVKEKKLPALDDELAKDMGYTDVADLKEKANQHLTKQKTEEADRKVRLELMKVISEKNPFDVPQALVESQTRALAQDWAGELKQQGLDEQMIQGALMSEIGNLKTRAQEQVRASLLLESIASAEKITVEGEELENEFKTFATSVRATVEQLKDYYSKTPRALEDFVFRARQEKTIKFLLDKAKIKSKS